MRHSLHTREYIFPRDNSLCLWLIPMVYSHLAVNIILPLWRSTPIPLPLSLVHTHWLSFLSTPLTSPSLPPSPLLPLTLTHSSPSLPYSLPLTLTPFSPSLPYSLPVAPHSLPLSLNYSLPLTLTYPSPSLPYSIPVTTHSFLPSLPPWPPPPPPPPPQLTDVD